MLGKKKALRNAFLWASGQCVTIRRDAGSDTACLPCRERRSRSNSDRSGHAAPERHRREYAVVPACSGPSWCPLAGLRVLESSRFHLPRFVSRWSSCGQSVLLGMQRIALRPRRTAPTKLTGGTLLLCLMQVYAEAVAIVSSTAHHDFTRKRPPCRSGSVYRPHTVSLFSALSHLACSPQG